MAPHVRVVTPGVLEGNPLLPQYQQERTLPQECEHATVDHHITQTATTIWHDLERRRDENTSIIPRNKWLSLGFGQFVTLVAASQNAASFALEFGMGKVFPMFLMFHTYVVLSLHLCWVNSPIDGVETHSDDRQTTTPSDAIRQYRIPFTNFKLRTPWWSYLCLSILDIGPNYLALQAMNRTSLTSATLLGSLTIPSTMLFCSIFLAKVYRPMHFVGVVLCMIGATLTILTDKTATLDDVHPHSYSGDILAVLAALGYGVGDAAAEFWSKHVDRKEYLGMLGLFGAMWTMLLFSILERDAIYDLVMDRETVLPAIGIMVWYLISLVAYYVAESQFLTKSDATLLNLSLQMSNFWAVSFSVLVFQEKLSTQFYIAVVLVFAGVFVYELCGDNNNSNNNFLSTSNTVSNDGAPESVPFLSRATSCTSSSQRSS
jgi:drug/metabolite transporter (DMT)-like permease